MDTLSQRAVLVDDRVAELITAVAKQDRAAFRQLYGDTSAKLMGVLINLLGKRAEAEDALQEVFIRVWLRATLFDARKGRGMTWLIAVARNHAVDRLRACSSDFSDNSALEEVADKAPAIETRMVALGEARRICQCIETLEPTRAAALRGAYLEGNSYVDLAAQFDMPLNTMRTHLRRSLIKLRICMNA